MLLQKDSYYMILCIDILLFRFYITLVCIVQTLLKMFHSADMVYLSAMMISSSIGSFLTENTPLLLDTITNGMGYRTRDNSEFMFTP